MSEVIRTIVNTQTGEVTTQPLTAEEIAELQAAESARLAEKAELDAAEAAKVAAKASALAKLAALGLTDEEIGALLK
jgi:hypothetical protein